MAQTGSALATPGETESEDVKAISLKQPWANMVAAGDKTIETRTWSTKYRGPLLIVSCKVPAIHPAGCAVAVAELVDCRAMTRADQRVAGCSLYLGAYAWVLDNVRRIEPFPVRGYQRLYEVETKGRLKTMEEATEATEAAKKLLESAMIDENTPVGRVYEFQDGGRSTAWRYEGVDQFKKDEVRFTDQKGADTSVPLHHWNTNIAPLVEEVRFAESEQDTHGTPSVGIEEEGVEGDIPSDTATKHLARICRVREDVLRQAKIVAALKADLKDARELYNEATAGLLAVIGPDPVQRPLFADPGDDDEAGDDSVDAVAAASAHDPAADESWRDVPLDAVNDPDQLQIKAKYVQALADNNPSITTVGELSDWQADKAGFWVKDIKGLGKAAADNIADALEVFWRRRKATA